MLFMNMLDFLSNPFLELHENTLIFRETETVLSYRWLHIHLTGNIKVLVVSGVVKYCRFYTSISISDRMNENKLKHGSTKIMLSLHEGT